MIERKLYSNIIENIDKQKVSVLLGARRVGKTILLEKIKEKFDSKTLWLNGEDETTNTILEKRTVANYKRLLNGRTLLIIDEAQYIKDIGLKVKLMIDNIKPLHIIITGSSAFDLSNASQPLVGRTITYSMFAVAQLELGKTENILDTKNNLEERLIYGSYPEVISLPSLTEKQKYLSELVNTYLLKDILAFENVQNPQKLKDLLVLLAYQVGCEVSLDELGRQLFMSKNTVDRYLDLLSKVFIIYKHKGYSNNLRKEVVKSSHWYFYDNGVRNALINNFNLLALRQDAGMLWENYVIAERKKYMAYSDKLANHYFWRTYDQQEIDLVEEINTKLHAFECKYKLHKKVKPPTAFINAYPKSKFTILHPENYLEFIE